MNQNTSVVYVRHTQHVLAAATRHAEPQAKVEAADLAAPALALRLLDPSGIQPVPRDFEVPVDQLAAAVVDSLQGVLADPFEFLIENADQGTGQLARIASTAKIQIGSLHPDGTVTITVDKDLADPQPDLAVWGLLQREGYASVAPGKAQFIGAATDTTVNLRFATPQAGNTYHALILVAKRRPTVATRTSS